MTDVSPLPPEGRINLAEESDFDLGGMRVRPAERSIEFAGQRRELQPRVMQVLVALAKARPAVISRDKLIDQCWEGRIVGDDALNRCILALRHLAQEFEPAPFTIHTVPRVGHRLTVASDPIERSRSIFGRYDRRVVAAALVLLLLAMAGIIFWQQRNMSTQPVSIAVLPFRNVGPGDVHFAEGIGIEILGQLAREPQFRVAGSVSSGQFGESPDVQQVAERLNVEYVLEGSVRRQGDQVRVSADLVRASDGIRLWADSYDGKLNDIFAIQQRIGTAIADALQRKLMHTPALSGPLVTEGEAYSLYLTARSLLRTRNRRVGPTAVDILRDAIRIDPGYAPAWASLAEATQLQGALGDREEYIVALRKARKYAQHAVGLAPDLAEAHRALGLASAYGEPEGIAHLRRAAALAPNEAENLLALAEALDATGEFDSRLATVRRAYELDPLWFRTTTACAMALAELGDRTGSEALLRRQLPDKGANLNNALGRVGWVFADYSEAVRQWAIVIRSRSPRWGHTAERTLREATYSVGIRTGPLSDVPDPPATRLDWRVWTDAAPTAAEWLIRNRDPIVAGVYRKHNLVAAKLMLDDGRWRELVATYDGPNGLFGLGRDKHVRFDQLLETPIVALALRQAGRGSEADRLLREAEALIRTAQRRGRVPLSFDAEAAAVFAVQGKTGPALDALDRAYRRGWRQNSGTSLRDIADEPAFRSLQAEPRFKLLQTRITAHYARERREVEQVLKAQKPPLNSTPI